MPRTKTGGRKKGTPNKSTAEIKALAQAHGEDAIERLVLLMRGDDERTALAACKELLDRGYGRVPQAITGEGGKGPVMLQWMAPES